MPLRPDTAQRAMRAYDLMIRMGLGARRAGEMSGTTARTIIKWMEENGIPFSYRRPRPGSALQIVPARTPDQKVGDFLEAMARGDSASKAARDLGTSVRSMSRRQLEDASGTRRRILRKVGHRWKARFLPLYRHSIVLYGKLTGMDDTVQGRGQLAGPKVNQSQADDYTDIWWQLDLDPLTTTLSARESARYYRPKLLELLERRLLKANVTTPSLAGKFLGSAKVRAAAQASGRWLPGQTRGQMKVSRLEDLLQRYDVGLAEVRIGVDDNLAPRSADFVWVDDLKPHLWKMPTGRFQVFFLDRDNFHTYPGRGGLKIRYRYDVGAER